MLPDLGSTQQQAAVVVGFFLPLLLAVPIQSKWAEWQKTLFSVAAYAAAGLVVATAAGDLTGRSFWQATLTVLTLGVVGYQGVWKPAKVAPAIQAKTDVGGPPAPGWQAPIASLEAAAATVAPADAGLLGARVETLLGQLKERAQSAGDGAQTAGAVLEVLGPQLEALGSRLEQIATKVDTLTEAQAANGRPAAEV